MIKYIIGLMAFLCLYGLCNKAQAKQDTTQLIKLEHAEPLYIDLIRDLGARKGEKEWNVGLGIQDNLNYDEIELLVEYEWAVANRLGLEVEVPVSLYSKNSKAIFDKQPSNAVEGLKTAFQWTFLVNQKLRTSMAFGYINEIKFTELNDITTSNVFAGNSFNPFLVMAKRIGANFHSLVYTGPQFYKPFGKKSWESSYDVNTNFHYMIPSSRNFIGIEFNKTFRNEDFDMMIRPQMRVSIADNLMVGIVSGIPVNRENKRFQSFLRLIYEPGHKH
ncbi:hypothetical protein PBAC_25960 [Pedobacter glucosidilyticus]|nr:hypothetical protein PBAC_25960 [Pedobacter glucosidilyticus]